jgi:hypothetical protein
MAEMKKNGSYKKGDGLKKVIMEAKKTYRSSSGSKKTQRRKSHGRKTRRGGA